MTISNANSQILKCFPRFLLNQRWKSLSLCPTAPFLDVSVWSSKANTVRKCRCRRVGFETNSSSIAVSWRSGRWRNGGDTFQVRFPVNRIIRRVPRGESETPPSDFRHGRTCPYGRGTCGTWLPRGPVTRRGSTRSRDSPLNNSLTGDWSSQSPLFFSWIRTRATVAKSLGGVSLSPRENRRIFRFTGKLTGSVSSPFRQRPDRQRTAILLLFV
jgi:hypothetical protein